MLSFAVPKNDEEFTCLHHPYQYLLSMPNVARNQSVHITITFSRVLKVGRNQSGYITRAITSCPKWRGNRKTTTTVPFGVPKLGKVATSYITMPSHGPRVAGDSKWQHFRATFSSTHPFRRLCTYKRSSGLLEWSDFTPTY